MRVLDIGARDGFFSFELERRGADVVAIDYIDPGRDRLPGRARAARARRSTTVVDNVYRLSRERHGEFDIVLFLGVLYHLRDPLLALDRLWDVLQRRRAAGRRDAAARQRPAARGRERHAGSSATSPTSR